MVIWLSLSGTFRLNEVFYKTACISTVSYIHISGCIGDIKFFILWNILQYHHLQNTDLGKSKKNQHESYSQIVHSRKYNYLIKELHASFYGHLTAQISAGGLHWVWGMHSFSKIGKGES